MTDSCDPRLIGSFSVCIVMERDLGMIDLTAKLVKVVVGKDANNTILNTRKSYLKLE